MDARPGTPDETGLERLKRRAGGAYAELVQQGIAFGHELQRELDGLAGGSAPASVQALRELAVGQLMAHKAAQLVAFSHLREISEADVDDDIQKFNERWEKGQRLQAGLAVTAKDLIVEARKQAKDASLTLPSPGSVANDNGSGPLGHMGIFASPIEGDE